MFPIPPNGEKRIQLEYSQVIGVDAGLAKYAYPLRTDKFTDQPVENLAISVEIESNHAIKTIYSPSHDVEVVREDNHHVKVGYEGSNVRPDRDFVCYQAPGVGQVPVDWKTGHPLLPGNVLRDLEMSPLQVIWFNFYLSPRRFLELKRGPWCNRWLANTGNDSFLSF